MTAPYVAGGLIEAFDEALSVGRLTSETGEQLPAPPPGANVHRMDSPEAGPAPDCRESIAAWS